jgi:uncharacterized protein YjbI with pentapeptide repeats
MRKLRDRLLTVTFIAGLSLVSGPSVDAAKSTCNTRAAKVVCPRANLYGVDFSGRNLVGANFKLANLERAVFRGANLTGANFSGAKLGEAVFTSAILDKVTISGGSFSGIKSMRGAKVSSALLSEVPLADFTGSTFTSSQFIGNIAGAKFNNVTFKNVTFKDSEVPLADFTGSTFTSSQFIGNIAGAKFNNVTFEDEVGFRTESNSPLASLGYMQGTDFTGATFPAQKSLFGTAIKGAIGLSISALLPISTTLNLAEMDLSGLDLRTATTFLIVTNANLTNTDVSGVGICHSLSPLGTANISGLRAVGSQFQSCDFSLTTGSPATFENATLGFSKLSGVQWNGVNFSGADFDSANLTGAVLRNSNLSGARRSIPNFTGADFTGSTGTTKDFWWPRKLMTCPNGVVSVGCS